MIGDAPTVGTCRWCHRTRPLTELLIVTQRARPETRSTFVCRPSVYRAPRDPECFAASVGPAFVETISLASPAPRSARPAPEYSVRRGLGA